MLKRILVVLMACVLAAGVVQMAGARTPQQNEKSYTVERYDVDIDIQPGGDLLVTETVVFAFTGGPFTYVFREIPIDQMDGLQVIAAQMDGQTLPTGDQPGQVEIQQGYPVKITWHFAGVSDAVHTFTVQYRALAHIHRTGEYDALDWDILPNSHEYAIAASLARVRYPAGVELAQPPWVVRGSAQVEEGGQLVTLTASQIPADAPLQLTLRFPAGSLIGAAPAWQQAAEAQTSARAVTLSTGLTAGISVFALGMAALFWYWQMVGRTDREEAFAGRIPPAAYMLPSTLSPALAGLLASGARAVVWAHALGTLFDLARRGALVFEQREIKMLFRLKQFFVKRQSQPADLAAHEDFLLQMLFDSPQGWMDEVSMSTLTNQLQRRWGDYQKMLLGALAEAGYYSPARQQIGRRLVFLGALFDVSGSVSLVLALAVLRDVFGPAGWGYLIGSSIAALAVGFVTILVGASFSPLNAAGMAEQAAWKAFMRYLHQVARGKETPIRADFFEAYLPYAAAFGLAPTWTRHFQKRGDAAAPAWFIPLSGVDGAEAMAAFTGLMDSSTASGDSGSGGGGGDGGGGGGGSSGAG